jgi:1-phosphofructokinase
LNEKAVLDRMARLATAFAVAKLGMLGPSLGAVLALADDVDLETMTNA